MSTRLLFNIAASRALSFSNICVPKVMWQEHYLSAAGVPATATTVCCCLTATPFAED
jgi:hypothetical protein